MSAAICASTITLTIYLVSYGNMPSGHVMQNTKYDDHYACEHITSPRYKWTEIIVGDTLLSFCYPALLLVPKTRDASNKIAFYLVDRENGHESTIPGSIYVNILNFESESSVREHVLRQISSKSGDKIWEEKIGQKNFLVSEITSDFDKGPSVSYYYVIGNGRTVEFVFLNKDLAESQMVKLMLSTVGTAGA